MSDRSIPLGASIAVIGAGIVGVTSALQLARRGYSVIVYDPHPPGLGGASHRNAGQIGASDVQPLSTPGIAMTGLKLMVKKDSPLRIPGVEKIKLMGWFLRFLATSRGARYRDACAAMTFLCREAYGELDAMLTDIGIAEKATFEGAGFIYNNAKSHQACQPNWKVKQAAGFNSDTMTRADIARQLPEMDSKFTHGMLSHNWGCVTDPLEITQDIAQAAKSRGVLFQTNRVTALMPRHTGVTLVTPSRQRQFDAVIVAAGVHSRAFAATLGDRLPLIAERGYNLTFPDPGFRLTMPLIMPDRGLAITQLSEGLRIGGWAEYVASPERPATKSYYTALARISSEIFPRLNQTGAIAWMGNRPTLPDSIPVISRSLKNDRVFYNCGHGHYGLTNCALSASILSGIMAGEKIPDTHKAYAIDRFNR